MRYGLLGEHLTHSFSKQIHESLADYKYDLIQLNSLELEAFLKERGFFGVNVTIPYKEKVIPYLDELSETASNVKAVNCIVNRNGKLYGDNTDVYGFIAQLKHMRINPKNKSCLILGTGGASKAVKYGLSSLGASNIQFASRKKEGSNLSYEEIYRHHFDIVVNCTPVGMYPNNEDVLIDLSKFDKIESYIDLIYNPIRTKTVLQAQELGITAEGGLYMLVAQAIKAIELFKDIKIDEIVIDNTYSKILKENSNIVFIGMPSSGKSTISKEISKKFNIPLIDTDEEIVKIIQMEIKDYFAQYGEEAFRNKETEVVKSIYQKTPYVISTGGGIILNHKNMSYLKQNGFIYFIERDLDKLVATSDRPLSSNINDLKKLYEYRLPLYKKYADKIIDNNNNIEHTLHLIKEEVKWKY